MTIRKDLAPEGSLMGRVQGRPERAEPGRASADGLYLCICIATYRRPEGLLRLLTGLDKQRFPTFGTPRIEVIVVDNDVSSTGGREISGGDWAWPVSRLVEPRPGISYARNTAVGEANARGADLVAFIDDDEEPETEWLEKLLTTMYRESADVVTGPVLPRFEGKPPAWMLRRDFFGRDRFSTGTRRDRAYTGNVLVRSGVLAEFAGPFNEDFGLSGGEDLDLFLRVTKAGYSIVWDDDAVVYEWQPQSRLTAGWLLRRPFRTGNIWARLAPGLQPSYRKAARSFARGLCALPVSILTGRHDSIWALQRIMIGAGFFMGKVGFTFRQYRRYLGRESRRTDNRGLHP